jgi:exodeoxyribonuclease V beta subunit
MKEFVLSDAPLEGVHLIEAGAGTGKTYTIAGIFLRLIAEKGVPVDQILVVSYTKAATEELKNRIRRRLLSAGRALDKAGAAGAIGDPLAAGIAAQVSDRRSLVRQRIRDALIDFDRAAIFTIHGFCQRVLNQFAFETGHLFEAELTQNAQPLIQETADDFWRRYISRAPEELVHAALDQLKSPEALAGLVQRCRLPLVRVIPEAVKPPLTAIVPWRRAARQVCDAWPQARQVVLDLLGHEGLNALKYGKCAPVPSSPRRQFLSALAAAMDRWNGRYPPFPNFERFCQSHVAKAVKKGHVAPVHPFFQACEEALSCRNELDAQLDGYIRYLKVRLLAQVQQRLAQKKARDNTLFFDDLLLQVHAALHNERRQALAAAIGRQYQAALVDEFQDTDGLQYEIFATLFTGHGLFFMIGDPKQAIYSFRGADLFSYLRARENARNRFTLTRNWRATPALIKALNTVFGRRARPFGYEQIPYEKALAGRDDPNPPGAPFRLWYLTTPQAEEGIQRPLSQEAATERIVEAVADEIVRLLQGPGPEPAPEEIAVLTRTHRQAMRMKAALAQRRVPAVMHSAGSVFETPEAEEMARVLEAVAMPSDPWRVRTALAGDLFGVDAAALCAAVEVPGDAWQARWAAFDDYHQHWLRHGFYPMFARLMAREGVKQRLLAMPDGERRITNVLHLAELLHRAAAEHQLGPEGLLKWLMRRRAEGGEGEDAQKLRLESDAHAVCIITIHKSKGLQFKVVFCPFTWAGVKIDDASATFHDPLDRNNLTLAIGPEIDPAHQKLALEEALAENLRLMYVALTRARQRCYLIWGRIRGSELSAPAYLLHEPRTADGAGDWTRALQSDMAGMTDSRLIADLQALAESAQGTIALSALPESDPLRYHPRKADAVVLSHRRFERRLSREWRIASFSSMITALAPDAEADAQDRDAAVRLPAADSSPRENGDDLFPFPKGARAGLFFHDLLEHWDFSAGASVRGRALVAAKLQAHGFEARWQRAVETMLERLGQAPLSAGEGKDQFCLARVLPERRINEMEFYFPLQSISGEELKRCFKKWEDPFFTRIASRPLERLTFAPMEGFLKGYIDTLFEHKGRFYLVDWKSNHLGNHWDDYAPSRLAETMAEAYYFLQYHLYALALDLWLGLRLPDYDYRQHFGGVFYLFLRGIRGASHHDGIYHARPEAWQMADLRALLVNKRGAEVLQ